LNVQKSLQCYCFHVILLIFCFWNTSEPHMLIFSLRAALFSSLFNISAVAANCLLENEWGCIFDGNYRRSLIMCCSRRWLNTTDSVNTYHSDGMTTETWCIVWIGPNLLKLMEISVCQLQGDKLCSHSSFCVVLPLTIFQFCRCNIKNCVWNFKHLKRFLIKCVGGMFHFKLCRFIFVEGHK
jgi:hypothetical protein